MSAGKGNRLHRNVSTEAYRRGFEQIQGFNSKKKTKPLTSLTVPDKLRGRTNHLILDDWAFIDPEPKIYDTNVD